MLAIVFLSLVPTTNNKGGSKGFKFLDLSLNNHPLWMVTTVRIDRCAGHMNKKNLI